MTTLENVATRRWDLADLDEPRRRALQAIVEDGGVLCLPDLPLPEANEYAWLLDARFADPRRKNISVDPATQAVRGVQGDERVQQGVATLVVAFQRQARALIDALAPGYAAGMRTAAASLRLQRVEGRVSSWRKDDSRLHIDAFPSRPNQGERILRVFRNVNPAGEPRVWRVGEPFPAMAARFRPLVPAYSRLKAAALHRLHVTKSRRSAYDHVMLHLHDLMKADLAYQRDCPQQTVPFAAGCTWVCFSDQTSHAVMGGQFMLEQTLHPAVAVMQQPGKSPLSVLEGLWQTRLA